MKKRLLLVVCVVFIINSLFSTYAMAVNVKRGAALSTIVATTKNDNFKKTTKKNAYKVFKDNKTFSKKLKGNINVALANKIVKKSKRFYGKKALTRIELARWVYAAMKKTGYNFIGCKCLPMYKDIKTKSDRKVVNYLHSHKVMYGISKKKFAPNKKVSKKAFKKVIRNLKKAIDNSKVVKGPESVPTSTPEATAPIGVTAAPSTTTVPNETVAPSETTVPSTTAIPTSVPTEDAQCVQLSKNAWMETLDGYESNANGGVTHVKGYVGNGIKVSAGETVSTTLKNLSEAKGMNITFMLETKKLGEGNGKLIVKCDRSEILHIDSNHMTEDWTFFNDVCEFSNSLKDDVRVTFTAEGESFIIDNFNALVGDVNGLYRASYESDGFVIRAQIDHENGKILSYLPKEGNYQLKEDNYFDGTIPQHSYEEVITRVDTDNKQLLLKDGYEASVDKAGKVDYNVTIDGKKYVLLSGNGDRSGMRNYLAYNKASKYIADDEDDWPGASDLLTSASCEFVDLFADGQYLGVYTKVENLEEKNIQGLEFMVKFSKNGTNSVGDLKYDIVNSGTMSAENVESYIKDVNDAFMAFKTVGATSSQMTVFENTFAGLVDVYSCVDWMLFNEIFINSEVDTEFYVYKTEGNLLRFAVYDDFSISGENDDDLVLSNASLTVMSCNKWIDGLGYRRNILPLVGNRWFFSKWNVFKTYNDSYKAELDDLKQTIQDAYKYDVELWGTELDGADKYVQWIVDRVETIDSVCGGYGNEIW